MAGATNKRIPFKLAICIQFRGVAFGVAAATIDWSAPSAATAARDKYISNAVESQATNSGTAEKGVPCQISVCIELRYETSKAGDSDGRSPGRGTQAADVDRSGRIDGYG